MKRQVPKERKKKMENRYNKEQRRAELLVVRVGAPRDSHDPSVQITPPRMQGTSLDNLLDSPPSLCPRHLLWEGKPGQTDTLT